MRRIWGVVSALVFLLPVTAQAQTWSPEQEEVWKVVEASWVASDTDRDPGWYDEFVHPEFRGWSMARPNPLDRETSRRWNRYGMDTSKTVIFSLHPMSIVVQGNTAIAFYYVSSASEDLKGEHETTHSREVDTFVRENGKWMILGWMTGDESSGGG